MSSHAGGPRIVASRTPPSATEGCATTGKSETCVSDKESRGASSNRCGEAKKRQIAQLSRSCPAGGSPSDDASVALGVCDPSGRQ